MLRLVRFFFTGLALALGLLLVVAGAYLLWYFNRPLPEPVGEGEIFDGVTYRREIRQEPRRAIVHVVTIDLSVPGIGFLVTPADNIDNHIYAARTTSQFLSEFGLQLAINGDFFQPWRENGPFDYYPHVGDGVDSRGLTISQGKTLTSGYVPHDERITLYITRDNRASLVEPAGEPHNAISGIHLLQNGDYVASWGDAGYLDHVHPRTAVGIDASGSKLIIVVVDGRQPNYSDGANMQELADILLENGAVDALNLDGGGSSTLVIEGADGQPIQLGSAIHTRIPARERPTANHLGIYANHLDD